MCLRESMLAKIGKTLLCDKKRIVISSLFVKYLEHCLYGRKFLVKTPQLTSMADTKTQIDILSIYIFKIQHRASRLLGNEVH